MPANADSLLIYSYCLCLALLVIVFPLCGYVRDKVPRLSLHRKGLVSTDAVQSLDLLGLALFLGIYGVFLLEHLNPRELDQQGNPVEVRITPLILGVGMIVQFVPPMLVAVMLAPRGVRLTEFLCMKWHNPRYIVAIACFGVIGAYLFLYTLEWWGYSAWLENLYGDEIKIQESLKTYQEADAATVRIMIAVSTIIIAPIAEEIVFRGYIYTVTKRFSGPFFAAIFSSLFFGLVHYNVPAMVPLIFLALVLAISYEISGSIWAPISIHALFNASQILFQEIQFHQ